MNWIKCLLLGHSWKVRYVSHKCLPLFTETTSSVDADKSKRRAVICDRCGKELKVG